MDGTDNGNWSRLFTEFHARHRDANGKKLKFTAVFNTHMEVFIRESEVPLEWRFLAWIWRHAWGNNSDYAVKDISGAQLRQADFADEARVEKQRVSDAAVLLRGLNFLVTGTGQKLYPVDDPTQKPPPSGPDGNVKSPSLRGLFREFCEEWKVRASTDFQELESAEATVSRLKKVRLGLFKEWKRARTSGGRIIIDPTTTTLNNNNNSANGQPDDSVVVVQEAFSPYADISEKAAGKLIKDCRTLKPDCTAGEIVAAIHRLADGITRSTRNPIGMLLSEVPAAVKAAKPLPQTETEQERREREFREVLEHPDDFDAETVEYAREYAAAREGT